MAQVTISNIIIGAATLKVDGVDIGAITGGLSITKSTDVYPIEIDNIRAPVKHVPVKESFAVKTTMSEGTLENLRIVWNIPSSRLTTGLDENTHNFTRLTVGMSTGVVEHTLEVTGVAPNGLTRVYRTYRAISIKPAEHTYARTKETLMPVEFDVLPDLTKAPGTELGTITDYDF